MSVDNIIGIKPDFLVLRSITKSYKEKLVLSIDELKIGDWVYCRGPLGETLNIFPDTQ